jgi:hypothetical protein
MATDYLVEQQQRQQQHALAIQLLKRPLSIIDVLFCWMFCFSFGLLASCRVLASYTCFLFIFMQANPDIVTKMLARLAVIDQNLHTFHQDLDCPQRAPFNDSAVGPVWLPWCEGH